MYKADWVKSGVGLGETWASGHVTAAVSCCLEMALWRTLWMADQVSRMPSGGLSASFMRLLMNFLAWSGTASGLSAKGTRLMCGYLSNLVFSALLAMWPGRVLTAAMRAQVLEKGDTMATSRYVAEPVEVEDKIHTRMLPLSVHDG